VTVTGLLNFLSVDILSDYEAVGSQLAVPESCTMELDSPIDSSANRVRKGQQRNSVWTPGVETISHCLLLRVGFPV